ncbi:hypothetical protein RISK_000997 [Rhodopirellula islandica]|uniref:Uncharacterized protein n=1 Tax=Rhodopirellula islandica TaxID=595434 RepID=A0A0J1BKZ2_RHOIS|nr:hypothetical protein RISK_000997 [Rhodopirellula islandica]
MAVKSRFESVQSDVGSLILGSARTLPRQRRRPHWCEERAFNHQRGSGDFCVRTFTP